MSNEELKQRELNLRPRFTWEFMETIMEAYKVYGNTGDSVATQSFVKWCLDSTGFPEPDSWEVYQ